MENETIKINKGNTLMIAHRGISGLAKENSLASFELAGQSSHWGIETDVHVTKDKKFVIHHDGNLKRCTGVDLVIEDSLFEDIVKIPLLGMNNEVTDVSLYSPTLEQYLSICKKYNKHVVLELKEQMTKEDVVNIVKVVENMGLFSTTTFISFYPKNLIYLRRAYRTADIEFLVGKESKEAQKVMFILMRLYRFGLDIDSRLVNEKLIKKVHKMGRKINSWTVNDKETAEKFVSWGIDQITTNILE